MQISLFYHDLRSFSTPDSGLDQQPPRNHGGRHHTPPFHLQKPHHFTTMDASLTGRGVGVVSVPQSLAQPPRGADTSERAMNRADDLPPAGRIGAMEAHKNNTNHTTINREAGGGTRGWRRFETDNVTKK
eukprot:scaffold23145_cov67-Cyclotella_meneghiniana.AAC.1